MPTPDAMSTQPPTTTSPEVQDPEKQHVYTEEPANDEKALSSSPSEEQQIDDTPKPPTNPWADPSSFPDGGAKAWLTVAGASACFFVSWGWINCIGVFQDYFMRGERYLYI